MKPAYQLNIYIHFKGKLLEILSASKNKQIIKINVRKENKKLIYYFFFIRIMDGFLFDLFCCCWTNA